MAAKPQMTVRLAPSILHALEYLAEREGIAPAELARVQITAACQTGLDRHGWREDCQRDYMRWLDRRAAAARAADDGQGDGDGDIAVDGEPGLATADHVEPTAPYGAFGDQFPRMGGRRSAAGSGLIGQAEADRLVATLRPDGRKRRT
jgi:hypothetical protein